MKWLCPLRFGQTRNSSRDGFPARNDNDKYDSSKSDKLQNFSDDQTWYDYFGNMTIDNIKVHKALLQIADEKNFEYTAYDEDLAEFKDSIKSAADEASLSVADYYKQNFPNY